MKKTLIDNPAGYYIYCNNTQSGPFMKETLVAMYRGGNLPEQGYVAIDGAWVLVSDILWENPQPRPIPVPINISEDEIRDGRIPIPKPVLKPKPIPVPESNKEPACDEFDSRKPEPEPEPEISEEDAELLEEIAMSGKIATCPHCWHQFDMSRVNYISKHPDLLGDPIVGASEQRRFIPTRFNSQGYAIDAKGQVCTDMACPNCHLPLPISTTELPSSMFSIVGAPASGKSYYLTSAIWELRQILAKKFDLSLTDTDETFNAVLNNYESLLFLNRQQDGLVSLPKTEVAGADYTNQIRLNGIVIDLPKPFIFTLNPMPSHPSYENPDSNLIRNIVLYDNGGEHFEPGRDSVNNPSTYHLIYSDSIVFLYDPMKDIRLMGLCNPEDPQVQQTQYKGNQLILLNEMISRIRRYSGLASRKKYNKMLVVVLPKYDAWRDALPVNLEEIDYTYYSKKDMRYYLNMSAVINVSFILREMLLKMLPEVVAACESFFSTVYFLPASALGNIAEYDEKTDSIGIRPKRINPIWAEVPMLLQFWFSGLIEAVVPDITDNYIEIKDYKSTEDSIIYTLPGQQGRFSIPSNYLGRIVYSCSLGQYIRFPNLPTETGEPESDQGQSSVDDDFWK